jgi:hypothetical protein
MRSGSIFTASCAELNSTDSLPCFYYLSIGHTENSPFSRVTLLLRAYPLLQEHVYHAVAQKLSLLTELLLSNGSIHHNSEMDLRQVWVEWTGLMWLRTGISGGLSWTWLWTSGLHKILGNCWVGAQLAASQEGLSSIFRVNDKNKSQTSKEQVGSMDGWLW